MAAVAALLAAVSTPLLGQQTKLTRDQSEYDQQTDPVRKAKLLGEMGPLEVDLARETYKAGKDEESLDILTRYNDEVRQNTAALAASGLDPVRRPAGFKELQIGLRVTLRRLDDLIEEIPVDKRPWFRSVRSDLAGVHDKLLDALFRIKAKPPLASENQEKQP